LSGSQFKATGFTGGYLLSDTGNWQKNAGNIPSGYDSRHSSNVYNSDKLPSRSLLDAMITVLSGVFAFAVDSELISVNPVADIGRSLRLPREMKKRLNHSPVTNQKRYLPRLRDALRFTIRYF